MAIKAAKGVLADAAAALGMARSSLARMAGNHSTVARALKDERDGLIDFTEKKLWQRVNAGDTKAIIFTLSTIGKTRGWTFPRGTELSFGDTTNNVVIGSVVIQPIKSGEFVTGPPEIEIESVTGGIIDDCQTKKLN